MKKIGVFGTCRIENFDIPELICEKEDLPKIYRKKDMSIQFNIRPLGYTTTSSDIYQNLSLIKSGYHKQINNNFLYNNIFMKRGGNNVIEETGYDYLILEICSTKKIIHKPSKYIIPYEIEGNYNPLEYFLDKESKEQTILNIKKIKDLIGCRIILVPPIIAI